jgi:EpsG-like putative glucosyltransferase
MLPYVAMLALPGGLAMARARSRIWILLVASLYFLMIGFRFQVGADWNNYWFIYVQKGHWSLDRLMFDREPGYGMLMWLAHWLGWGMIFINAVSGLVFCWGFFSVAKRCGEPWLAVVIATPLLVVTFAMSGVRQAIAAGLVFHLMATWEDRSAIGRLAIVILASLFHFSAAFMLVFVVLATKAHPVGRVAGAVFVGLIMLFLVREMPESLEAYSKIYVGAQAMSAPGAIVEVGAIASGALIYFAVRQRWVQVHGDNPLYMNVAWASVLMLPAIFISPVGAYRFALYFWPMAMTIYGGLPSLIQSTSARLQYRVCVVAVAFAMLIGWLMFANNSLPWVPYKNWLLQPDGVQFIRHGAYKR